MIVLRTAMRLQLMTVVAIVIERSLVNSRAFSSSAQIQGVYFLIVMRASNPDSAPCLESHFDKCSVDFEFLVLSGGKNIDCIVRADEDGLTSYHVQGAIGPL